MKIYFCKISDQSKFKNTLFKLIQVVVTILTNSSIKYFFWLFSTQSVHIYNMLILNNKGRLNNAYLYLKLVYEFGLQGFLV